MPFLDPEIKAFAYFTDQRVKYRRSQLLVIRSRISGLSESWVLVPGPGSRFYDNPPNSYFPTQKTLQGLHRIQVCISMLWVSIQ